jgi:hypothetical protein
MRGERGADGRAAINREDDGWSKSGECSAICHLGHQTKSRQKRTLTNTEHNNFGYSCEY